MTENVTPVSPRREATVSVAPSNPYRPTEPGEMRLRHKMTELTPRNPAMLRRYVLASSLMPEDKDRLCAFIMEEEAPERILAMFSKEEAERRAWNRKYRFFLLELSMDKLDTANPDFQYIKRAVNENCDYILSRCNVANGPSERILQDLEMTQDNVTQTVINSSAPQKKGWMSFFSKGG